MFAYELTAGQMFRITRGNEALPEIYKCVEGNRRNGLLARYNGVVGQDKRGGQHGFGEYNTVELVATTPAAPVEFADADTGLGIGGIRNDQSATIIPSHRVIARAHLLNATDIVCNKCGASKNFDGAMFTTIAGGNICDDCI